MGGERVVEFLFLTPLLALYSWSFSRTWNVSTAVFGLRKIDAPRVTGKRLTSNIHVVFNPKVGCGRKPPYCPVPIVSLYALHNNFVFVKYLLVHFSNTRCCVLQSYVLRLEPIGFTVTNKKKASRRHHYPILGFFFFTFCSIN